MKLRVILHEILQLLLSACIEDKTLTVQCIFVAKNGLLASNLYPSAYPFKKYISVMFYDNFCWNSVAKYLEKKGERA